MAMERIIQLSARIFSDEPYTPPSSEALQAIGLGIGGSRASLFFQKGIGHTAGFQTAQQQSALDLG